MIGISLVLVLVGIVGCLVISLTKEKWGTFIFGIVALIGCFSFAVFFGDNIFLTEDLSKEVNLQRVSVKGQNAFRSQIEIVYKDGKLDKITLVSGTTIPEAADVKKK